MVCRVEQGLLPVCVINVTNFVLTLMSDMTVGTLFTNIEVGDEVEQHTDSALDSQHTYRPVWGGTEGLFSWGITSN